jgi:1-acyl-sn-glycerol-3-phosphate acyltransferase
MMKKLWYYFLRTYTQIGFFFYFKKILTYGQENIPRKRAVFFVSNHPNALIDPLLIATTDKRITYYFTRSGVFKNKLVEKLLYSVNMLPVYRMSDGINTLQNNEKVFAYAFDRLNEQFALLIFAEGSHSLKRRVRPLSKGFTRIIFGALDRYPGLEIDIVPVGINYSDPTRFGSSVAIFYGKPIHANPYWQTNDKNKGTAELVKRTSEALKEIVCHIGTDENYEAILQNTKKEAFLDPVTFNQSISTLETGEGISQPEESFNLLQKIVSMNSFLPLLVWRYFEEQIHEKEFIATYKFTLGITVFPLFYILQSLMLGYLFGKPAGWMYFGFSLLSVWLLAKIKK